MFRFQPPTATATTDVGRLQLRALVTIQTLRAYETQSDACPPAAVVVCGQLANIDNDSFGEKDSNLHRRLQRPLAYR